ncbi:coiled-coil domain-containing protein 113 isoform X2 [Oryzias melastigma]|nr:coiled-coil domain-containing protein 113 isoform X2 [Oryzias melastigma]XP_024138195.1 coiled-coil domain-containing protein 113 isoform X2 [Oryzias melastigma]XP_036068472.1 coiled-coil domain-containing protein 113 isoform X2 [Oryzias melastigma]
MLERYMERLDPKELLGSQESEPQTKMLTCGQKLHIAQQEMKETRQEKEHLKQEFERIIESRKASLMEADSRRAEIRKAKDRFERNVLNFMGSDQPQKTDAEKLLRCIQDRSKMTKLEMFNQKNMSLRLKIKNLLQQLNQKKEKQEKEDLEVQLMDQEGGSVERNVTDMKRKCFQEQQEIASHTEEVQRLSVESSELDDHILKGNQMLELLEEKTQHAESERQRAETRQQRLRRQMEDYQVPDVTEYMKAKARLRALQAGVHSMQRKVAIAERSLKSCSRVRIKQEDTLKSADAAGHNCRENPTEDP